jgi:hypothetical protein
VVVSETGVNAVPLGLANALRSSSGTRPGNTGDASVIVNEKLTDVVEPGAPGAYGFGSALKICTVGGVTSTKTGSDRMKSGLPALRTKSVTTYAPSAASDPSHLLPSQGSLLGPPAGSEAAVCSVSTAVTESASKTTSESVSTATESV